MLANVIYNRSDRCYEVENGGKLLTFPAGANGRREAFQAAVQAQDYLLHSLAAHLCREHPQLSSRIWRACEIVLNDGVTLQGEALALVASQSSEYGDYTVQDVDGLMACDCEDFQGATAVYMADSEQPYCKHILAYYFAA